MCSCYLASSIKGPDKASSKIAQGIVPIPEQRECTPCNSTFLKRKRYADFLFVKDSPGPLIFNRGKPRVAGGELDEFGYRSPAMLRDLNDKKEEGIGTDEFLF